MFILLFSLWNINPKWFFQTMHIEMAIHLLLSCSDKSDKSSSKLTGGSRFKLFNASIFNSEFKQFELKNVPQSFVLGFFMLKGTHLQKAANQHSLSFSAKYWLNSNFKDPSLNQRATLLALSPGTFTTFFVSGYTLVLCSCSKNSLICKHKALFFFSLSNIWPPSH